jgi:acetoin utilization deacetylase AcuC-like enzyme
VATGYVWDERYAWHDTGNHAAFMPAGDVVQPLHHVESPESKTRIAALVEVSGLADRVQRLRPQPVEQADLARVHTQDYIQRIRTLSQHVRGGDAGDLVTTFGRGGYDIAAHSAGGTTAALDAVLRGEVDNAYALVRPPGHHAEPHQGMGFCIFNNIAVAIAACRQTHDLGRVAVIDWDVHHGNGTQTAFWDDPTTLTLSIHQDRLFPQNSGFLHERGGPGAEGANLNLALTPGCGDGAYLAAMERVALPALERFKPDVVIVACGFDAGAFDPLGQQLVSTAGFVGLTRALIQAASGLCDGRVVMSHEGGYNPATVPFNALGVLEELAGIDTGITDPFQPVVDGIAGQELQPHQRDAIDKAAEASS